MKCHFVKNVYFEKALTQPQNTRPVVVGRFGQLVDVDAPFKVELKPEGHEKEAAVVPPYLLHHPKIPLLRIGIK